MQTAPLAGPFEAESRQGKRGKREASAKLFRDGGFVVLGLAGAKHSRRIIARIRYHVNNYLLGMYSNACAILGKGHGKERAYATI